MTEKRLSALLFLAVIVLAPLITWFASGLKPLPLPNFSEIASGEYSYKLESKLKNNFPRKDGLSSLAWNVRYRTGTKEIDGYFITEESIIKNLDRPDAALVETVGNAIRSFARRAEVPTYFMLIPTACAVKQQELPSFSASIIYNQKSFIENVYQSFGGELYVADVYSILVANQSKYLYYNTQDSITPLGGYYVYSVLGDKMDATVRTIDNYTIEYVLDDYYGPLQAQFPYARVQPDLLSLYHFRSGSGNFSRNYLAQYTSDGQTNTQSSLYDREKLQSANPLDVYLGGIPQLVNLTIYKSDNKPTPNQTKLLLIGDATAAAYVPFLTPHYSEIQIVNAATATQEQLESINVQDYHQVLFAFSTDTYMHEENLRILHLLG